MSKQREKKLATQVVLVRDCAVCFTVSQREILRAAQAKLANREKRQGKKAAARQTWNKSQSFFRCEGRPRLRQFCSNNAVGDGVMSNSRKRKTERPEL